jgi:hypothetical protein
MSLCITTYLIPGFSILDFVPGLGLPAFPPPIPSLVLLPPVCLADEF